MAITLGDSNGGKVLEVRASGKLTHADYQVLLPAFEQRLKQHHRLRVLFEMADFHGWELAAFWDDVKFDVTHYADVERFAMVGDQKWEKDLTNLSRPFTAATVRYFDRGRIEDARRWLMEAA